MFGVEVLLRYVVPGAFITFPLIPVITGHSPATMSAAETSLAIVVVLVLGYLAHQFYWWVYNELRVWESERRAVLRVIRDQYLKEANLHDAWVEWQLWFYKGGPELGRDRATRLWLFVHTSWTAAISAAAGLLVLVIFSWNSFELRNVLFVVYVALVLGFARLASLNWHYVDEWESELAKRHFVVIKRSEGDSVNCGAGRPSA